jgi:hypothetical protein
MDPDACYRRFLDAQASGDLLDAQLACRDLCQWIDRGGFMPAWSADERKAFFAYSCEPFCYSDFDVQS